jgi:hypothetical protein
MAALAFASIAAFATWYFYVVSAHPNPDPAVGRVLRGSSHGHRFYLTQFESRGLFGLLVVFAFSTLLAILLKAFCVAPKKE